jgi:protein gp37
MSDLFHPNVPFKFVDQVFAVMALCKQHTFQILTKRPERMRQYCLSIKGREFDIAGSLLDDDALSVYPKDSVKYQRADADIQLAFKNGILSNVHLGVSAGTQEAADERIPLLLDTPAAVRWVSIEPMLSAIDLSCEYLAMKCGGRYPFTLAAESRTKIIDLLDWIVLGGESGPHARPMHPAWARTIRDQCNHAKVPFLFKQWGEWAPTLVAPGGDLGGDLRRGHTVLLHGLGNPEGFFSRGDAYLSRVGKKAAGRFLDGVLWDQYPGKPAVT